MTVTTNTSKNELFDILKFNIDHVKDNLECLVEKIMPYDQRIEFYVSIKKVNDRYKIIIESEDFTDILPKNLVREVKILNFGSYLEYSKNAIRTSLSYRYMNNSGEVVFEKIADIEIADSGAITFIR